ncbi:g3822 [Coccomyxa elongata]
MRSHRLLLPPLLQLHPTERSSRLSSRLVRAEELSKRGTTHEDPLILFTATKLEKALKEALPDAVVSVNPEKPRKGCFEVRDADGGKTYVSLLDMPRPFTKLKALDIDELAKEIAGASASA